MSDSLPVGLAMIICDSMHREADGKRSLVGLLNQVDVDSFPFMLPRLSIYFAVTEVHAAQDLTIVFVDGSSEEVLFHVLCPVPEAVSGLAVVELDLSLEPVPIEFQGPGICVIRVLVKDQIVLQRSLQLDSAEGNSPTALTAPEPARTTSEGSGPAVEMVFLGAIGDTVNKLRWQTMLGETVFRLYIPKWRVPEPWPQHITVTVEKVPSVAVQLSEVTPEMVQSDPAVRPAAIRVIVDRVARHTRTIRYRPRGEPTGWELGEPYIPFELTGDGADQLLITVDWALGSRGRFQD